MQRKTVLAIVLSILSLTVSISPSSEAAPVLDQFSFESVPVSGGAGFGSAPLPSGVNKDLAQVFVIANTGILNQIDLVVDRQDPASFNGDLFFDIRPVIAGTPVEDNALALVSREFPNVPGCPPAPCNGNIVTADNIGLPVTKGEELAIVLRGGFNSVFVWFGGQYDPGDGFLRSPGEAPFPNWAPYLNGPPGQTQIFAFQSFVECADPADCQAAVFPPPSPPVRTPEPATLLLLVAGVLGMSTIRRIRRARLVSRA